MAENTNQDSVAEPSAWLVRCGDEGQFEQRALSDGLIIAGWDLLGDINICRTREDVRQAVEAAYPEVGTRVAGNWAGQLWRFVVEMSPGDHVVMPLRSSVGYVAIGRIAGPYAYWAHEPAGFRHVREVKWIRDHVAREEFRPDLRASIGSLLTVCGLTRNDAARRIAHLAEHGTDPGVDGGEEITTAEELLEDAVSRNTENPRRLTIRDFLEHWGETRRTSGVVAMIRTDLADKGLTTRPPFTEGSVEDEIELVPVETERRALAGDEDDTENVFEPLAYTTLRIANLPPPKLVSVPPTETLTYVKTVMLDRQFSQLGVIDEGGTFHGAVSWESIGMALVGLTDPCLKDAIVSAVVVDHDAHLLDQIDTIYHKGYVFVRDSDHARVTGIVTASDLTRQFGSLARPFVLIEEAENRLRRRADEVFGLAELRDAAPPARRSHIRRAADLTLGTYPFLLKPRANWGKLGWDLHQDYFLSCLSRVAAIRNELMHFTPDPLSEEQYAAVEGLLKMLRTADPRP